MKYLVLITARMSSKRLPGKVMIKIKGDPIIKIIIDRIKKSKKKYKIVVATTTKKSDDILVNFLKKEKILFYRGEEKNVIKRVIDASNYYDAKNIILITGDCPLVDFKLIDKCVNIFEKNNCDFVTNAHIRSYPDGMDVQLFKLNTLKYFYKTIKKKREYEHVTLSMRRRIKTSKIINIIATKKFNLPELGLTLDEINDLKLIKKIFNHFWKNSKKYFDLEKILLFLKDNKKLLQINNKVKRKGDN